MDNPCKDCLILPQCRHKHYREFVHECSTMRHHLYTEGIIAETWRREDFLEKLRFLEDFMKPSNWKAVYLKTYKNEIYSRDP